MLLRVFVFQFTFAEAAFETIKSDSEAVARRSAVMVLTAIFASIPSLTQDVAFNLLRRRCNVNCRHLMKGKFHAHCFEGRRMRREGSKSEHLRFE